MKDIGPFVAEGVDQCITKPWIKGIEEGFSYCDKDGDKELTGEELQACMNEESDK